MVTSDDINYFKNSRRMKKNLIYVQTNAFNIPERIREIDSGYFVMFNPDTGKYEVHHKEQDYTLALNLPYDELDARAIRYVHETRVENIRKIQAEIEANNEKIEFEKEMKRSDMMKDIAGDIHSYCTRHESKEKPDDGAFKTRFV